MAYEEPDLVLTKQTYIQYITNAPIGQRFYYKRELGFNIKFMQNDLKINHNIDVKYDGEYNADRRIYKLVIVYKPTPPEEIIEQKTIFFDPVNLLG